jgi:hypothetical protein
MAYSSCLAAPRSSNILTTLYTIRCPTTGRSFTVAVSPQTIGGRYFFWACCPWCDAQRRPITDPDYDAFSPQVHLYLVHLPTERGAP